MCHYSLMGQCSHSPIVQTTKMGYFCKLQLDQIETITNTKLFPVKQEGDHGSRANQLHPRDLKIKEEMTFLYYQTKPMPSALFLVKHGMADKCCNNHLRPLVLTLLCINVR